MEERQKLLKIYGPSLCNGEAEAIAGMNRMLLYESHLRDAKTNSANNDDVHLDNVVSENALSTFDDDSDVWLPPYARTQLEIMRNAKTLDGKQQSSVFHEIVSRIHN